MSNTLWNKRLTLLWRKSCTPCQDPSCRGYFSAASEEEANSPKHNTGTSCIFSSAKFCFGKIIITCSLYTTFQTMNLWWFCYSYVYSGIKLFKTNLHVTGLTFLWTFHFSMHFSLKSSTMQFAAEFTSKKSFET